MRWRAVQETTTKNTRTINNTFLRPSLNFGLPKPFLLHIAAPPPKWETRSPEPVQWAEIHTLPRPQIGQCPPRSKESQNFTTYFVHKFKFNLKSPPEKKVSIHGGASDGDLPRKRRYKLIRQLIIIYILCDFYKQLNGGRPGPTSVSQLRDSERHQGVNRPRPGIGQVLLPPRSREPKFCILWIFNILFYDQK